MTSHGVGPRGRCAGSSGAVPGSRLKSGRTGPRSPQPVVHEYIRDSLTWSPTHTWRPCF